MNCKYATMAAGLGGSLLVFLALLVGTRHSPTAAPERVKVTPRIAITFENFAVLLAPDGSLWSWAHTNPPTATDRAQMFTAIPQRTDSALDWTHVAVNHHQVVALKSNGTLWAWDVKRAQRAEERDPGGRLSGPTQIGSETHWTQIVAGAEHCLGLKTDGSLWSWGRNNHGQLGNGTTNNESFPIRIESGSRWKRLAAGNVNSYALKEDGTVWGWGRASGANPAQDDLSPRRMDFSRQVVAISAKDFLLVALRSDGTLWIEGANAPAAAGSVSNFTGTLVQAGKDKDWSEAYAGKRCFFARKRNGSWWICGLLRNAPRRVLAPRRVSLRMNPCAMDPGLGDALLLTEDGTVWFARVQADASPFARGITLVKGWVDPVIRGKSSPANSPLKAHAQRIWKVP